MSSTPQVVTEIRDGVGVITLNRPESMNAISVDLARGLDDALVELAATAAVIMIRGAGGNFCVGGDFDEVMRLRSLGAPALAELFDTFGAACSRIASIDVPVVAAVEGFATAGGFELMLASDIVLVADNARLADHHTNFAQIPGGGSTQRLPRLVGRQRALAIILSGGSVSPAQAVDAGIAHSVIAADRFDTEVEAFARDLAGRSRAAATKIKRLVRDGLDGPLDEGLASERRLVVDHILNDPDAAAAADAFLARSTTRTEEQS